MCLIAADPTVRDNTQHSVMQLCYYEGFPSSCRGAWSSIYTQPSPKSTQSGPPHGQGTINSLPAVQSTTFALKAKGGSCQSISLKLKCTFRYILKISPSKGSELVLLGYKEVIPKTISNLLLSCFSHHMVTAACTKWKRVFFTCRHSLMSLPKFFSPPLLP